MCQPFQSSCNTRAGRPDPPGPRSHEVRNRIAGVVVVVARAARIARQSRRYPRTGPVAPVVLVGLAVVVRVVSQHEHQRVRITAWPVPSSASPVGGAGIDSGRPYLPPPGRHEPRVISVSPGDLRSPVHATAPEGLTIESSIFPLATTIWQGEMTPALSLRRQDDSAS